jgi:selenocysteine-specific elongation factor
MRRLVLGTAGHIDHGKTALVRALTGTDTDRLPEEKRRGITIDLGFASLDLPDGTAFSIVDVPGHEAFIRNMVAGASGIDMVLLVVAADEGVMPQTREHLAIIELLGIERGVVVLSKTDLVDADWLDLVRDDVHSVLRGTSLARAAVVGVSARTGAGLDVLRDALRAEAAHVGDQPTDDLFRMPIDRVFTVRGTGTVVTGTVRSGSLRVESPVRLLPAGLSARVRAIQQHGRVSDAATAGSRAAVALGGIDRQALRRGDTLVTSPAWVAAGILTVVLDVVRDAAAPVRPRQRVRVHAGTAEILGRIGMLSGEIAPGGRSVVQLRLEEPVLARAGDRVVIRSYSPVHTIAGGIVVEPAAPKRRRADDEVLKPLTALGGALAGPRAAATSDDDRAVRLVRAAVALQEPLGAVTDSLAVHTGLTPVRVQETLARLIADGSLAATGERVVSGDRMRAVEDSIMQITAAFHSANPSLDGMEREGVRRRLRAPMDPLFDAALDRLVSADRIMVNGAVLAAPGHTVRLTDDARAALDRLASVYTAAGLQPPELAELPADLARRSDLPLLLRFLERDGTLMRLSATRWISARAVSDGVTSIRSQLMSGAVLEVNDFKNVLNLTRKHLIPLLEHLDRTGVTRRDGAGRVLV